jgi:citrate synthase
MTVCEYRPGLEGIPAAQSSISFVDGQKGILEYRGIRIEELAEKSTFLETAYLLIWGVLPTGAELEEFADEIRYHRRIKYRIEDMMKCFPEKGHPMDALQTSAKIPTMVAAFQLIRKGNHPIQPNDSLDYAANFLYMLTERRPTDLAAKVFDVCLTLHAEHTMNASTFSAMVTASTLTDPYGVIASAVGTLAGPLHGGANEEVLLMLEEIGSVANVRPYVEKCIANKQKVMGFGHRVYKVKDPRATILQNLAEQLFAELGSDEYYDIALELEQAVVDIYGEKGIYANVDFYSGLVYRKLGIPSDLFTPIFAISRVAGWLAHWKEQLNANRIFRPTQIYTGQHEVPYTPIEQRS